MEIKARYIRNQEKEKEVLNEVSTFFKRKRKESKWLLDIFSGKLLHPYQLSNKSRYLWVKSENYCDEIVMIKTQNHACNQGKRNSRFLHNTSLGGKLLVNKGD